MKFKGVKSVLFALIFVAGSALSAQQITKFGVVDTAKVYNAYFRNSTSVRNYEKKKADFQQEINKYTEELQKLQAKKMDYEKAGNDAMVQRTQAEITKKTDTLSKIAESGGYSMILSLQQSNAILWYSNSVDITEQVIAELGR